MQPRRHSGQAKRDPESIDFSGFPLEFIPMHMGAGMTPWRHLDCKLELKT